MASSALMEGTADRAALTMSLELLVIVWAMVGFLFRVALRHKSSASSDQSVVSPQPQA
jgi:hypothetical protein